MSKRAAIILAGGKGQRFQTKQNKWQDKALALLYGKPFLAHVVENLLGVVDEFIVVVNENSSRLTQYIDVLANHNLQNVNVVMDLKIKNLHGPLVAIFTGLKTSSADICFVVPADMPMLNCKVADYMLNQLKDSVVEVPMWPNGKLETLLMVLDRKKALKIAQTLCQLERSHPDDIIRGSQNALLISPFEEIKNLDPELKSFVNINSQEDLSTLKPRQGQGDAMETSRLTFGELPTKEIEQLLYASAKKDKGNFLEAATIFGDCASLFEKNRQFFWAAVSREFEAKCLKLLSEEPDGKKQNNKVREAFLAAAQNYGLEAGLYEGKHGGYLAVRAKKDQEWCQNQIKNGN